MSTHPSELAKFNIQATINSGVVRMPVGVFEAAFILGNPIPDASEELIDAVNAYLSQAYAINAIVDIFLGHLSGSGSQSYAEKQLPNLQKGCSPILEVLEKLRTQLKLELKALETKLNKL